MVTQADIAKAANINRTSVTRILCGTQLNHFSEESIEKVKKAAADLGYKHRNFKNAMNIAFLVPFGARAEAHNIAERTMEAILGINEALKGTKHRLQLVNIDIDKQCFDFESVANGSDAFILWGVFWSWTKSFVKLLDKQRKDYVFIANPETIPSKGSYIIKPSVDEYIENALSVLTEAGHKHIGGIIDSGKKVDTTSIKNTFEKFELKFTKDNIMRIKHNDAKSCMEIAAEIARKGFTAVFVHPNDVTAFNLAIELRKLNKRIPDDISILGNHKKKSLPMLDIDLASFTSNWFEMGKRAGKYIIINSSKNYGSRVEVKDVMQQEFYAGNSIKKIN